MERADWHALSAAEVVQVLEVDPESGLSQTEVEKRLAKYGPNELKQEEKTSPWAMFIGQFKNILILILIVAIVLSALVGETVDAVIIAVIVVFCAVLGFIQEYRAEKALEALKGMLSPTITVFRQGTEQEVPSKDLVPGDIIILKAGDKIPADARIIECYSLRCDEAPLTGESVPVGKNIQVTPLETKLNDRKNMVFAGTAVTYGRGMAAVCATAMNTAFGQIAQEVATVETEKTPLEKRTEEIGKWLGIISLGICILVAGISIIREAMAGKVEVRFIVTMVMFAVSLAVAAVPEALAAIVTGALAIGMRQMAKRNALVRKMPAVETLGCTTVICSDKTGTLTKGEMTVRRVWFGGEYLEVAGTGYTPQGKIKSASDQEIGPDNIPSGLKLLLQAGLLCNDSELLEKEGSWRITGDPTEGALVVLAVKAGLRRNKTRLENPRVDEIPFSSETKRMTTVHQMHDGRRLALMKGAPEIVLEKCAFIQNKDQSEPLTDKIRFEVLKANEDMAQRALRVLALAWSHSSGDGVCAEENFSGTLTFLGLVGMMDPPREEVIEATKTCRQVKIKPVMITGDHKLTAVAVASEIGIHQPGDLVLTGDELEKLSDEELEAQVHQVTVYARVSPLDKLKIVKALKKRGEVVAMTGDGVNDAPALKHADIGVAMGITGTEVAKEAADMVLTDDNFASIVKAIELGRWIYDNIKKYLTFLLRCNITEVVVIGGTVLVMGPEYLPLLPAAILYINLATDGLPALALGVAPPDADIMSRPPRDPRESVFTKDVVLFIMVAVLIEIPVFFAFFFHKLTDITDARTEMFFLFIIVELIIAINFRSMRYSLIEAPPHKWLILAIIWEIALVALLIQFPTLRESFGINLPTMGQIGLIVAFGVVVSFIMEVLKAVIRKKSRRT